MFTRSSRILQVGASLALTTFMASAAPLSSRPKVTVGEFAVKISRALGYPVDDEAAASNSLRMAGVRIDSDLGAPLTEGRASDIMRDMGIDTTVSGNPDSVMSPVAADRAAASVALAASTSTEGLGGLSPLTESCTGIGDRATCYNCCTAALIPHVRYPVVAIIICGLICAKLYPPPSASQPAP